jgi:transposase
MEKVTFENCHAVVLELQACLHRSKDSQYEHKLHAVLLVAQGLSCRKVARLFADTSGAVERWVKRFRVAGLSGLRLKERSGRRPRLNTYQFERTREQVRHSPRSSGIDADNWTARLLAAWIAREWAIKLQVRQCQRILRGINVEGTGQSQ